MSRPRRSALYVLLYALVVVAALQPSSGVVTWAVHKGALPHRSRAVEMRKGTMLCNPSQYSVLRKLARTDATIQRPSLPSQQQHAEVVEITIPDGFAPGDVMQIAYGGVEFEVEVPATCSFGDVVRITLPTVDQAEAVPLAHDCKSGVEDVGCETTEQQQPEEEEEGGEDVTRQEPHCCYGRKYVKAEDAIEDALGESAESRGGSGTST